MEREAGSTWMDERKGDGMLSFHQESANKGAESPREDAGCELRSLAEMKVFIKILAEQASTKCSICSKMFLPLSRSGPYFTYLCDRSFDWSEAAPWVIPEWHYWHGRSHYPASVQWRCHRWVCTAQKPSLCGRCIKHQCPRNCQDLKISRRTLHLNEIINTGLSWSQCSDADGCIRAHCIYVKNVRS